MRPPGPQSAVTRDTSVQYSVRLGAKPVQVGSPMCPGVSTLSKVPLARLDTGVVVYLTKVHGLYVKLLSMHSYTYIGIHLSFLLL